MSNYLDNAKKEMETKDILQALAANRKAEATEMMVEQIEKEEYLYTIRNDEKIEIWIYKCGIYIPQGRSYIQEHVRRILGEAYTTYTCNQVISKIEADTFIESKDFFSNNIIEEVPVLNGLLNIFTKKLNDYDPKKIFFSKIPITYDTEKDCPHIKKHFNTVLKNKDDPKVIQELFGYLLLKDYKIEKAVMFNGVGRNGREFSRCNSYGSTLWIRIYG